MKRRYRWMLLGFGVLAVSASVFSRLPRCPINRTAFDRIKIGQTEQEVAGVVGKPEGNHASATLMVPVAFNGFTSELEAMSIRMDRYDRCSQVSA